MKKVLLTLAAVLAVGIPVAIASVPSETGKDIIIIIENPSQPSAS